MARIEKYAFCRHEKEVSKKTFGGSNFVITGEIAFFCHEKGASGKLLAGVDLARIEKYAFCRQGKEASKNTFGRSSFGKNREICFLPSGKSSIREKFLTGEHAAGQIPIFFLLRRRESERNFIVLCPP